MTGVRITASAVYAPGTAGDPPADQAHLLLGRKGLLFQEPAVRLALCAVHRALGLPPGRTVAPIDGAAGTAVVASSNFGNVQTVCNIVDQVRADDLRGVSPMQAPNASSNIVASSIAIRYGFTGPNLMICSGATGGLDALRAAALLIRGGRATRAVVVGTEPDDAVAAALSGGTPAAACVVLEAAGPGPGPYVEMHPVRRDDRRETAEPGWLRFGGDESDDSGATGVLRTARAARRLLDRPDARHALVTCGSAADGYAGVHLEVAGARP
ncbi:beta-ketoacyl synthase N-terminal-like domain-containing protein [Actinoplanes sp. NEAU-A12]|uniref:Beta-ketoacyl synthase N-terminal-like domain-containing protein n=1 Tax=Actinoplanes sandaracinus TaxID=3045177 RepID=A0ABT6WHQ3_9ACTN|nr:beta-ketoacyl synthase N-terminal-like domain-containing protein [Actinoplanes sandaracinus]MDI6099263.1 beta-ketoacyl synthase N-terminal-like domain-containing protein [Actinoplanes sandaracinus]